MGAFLTNDLPQFEPATGWSCAWRLTNCTNGWGSMVYRASLPDLRLCIEIRRHLERSVPSPDVILRLSVCATVLGASE